MSDQDGTEFYGMNVYDSAQTAIGEVHARPYLLIEPPRALLQLVFMNDGNTEQDRATMAEISERLGAPSGDPDSPYHGLTWEQGDLHCEKYPEFSTYLWSAQRDARTGEISGENPFKQGFTQPGPVLCGIRLDVLPWSKKAETEIGRFDATTRCHSIVEDGRAHIVTDFRQDAEGLTRILVLDKGLPAPQLGALVQRLFEIETYRVLALLGSPASRALVPRIREMEERLTAITEDMRTSARSDSEKLLSRLTDLSAELEADSAAILYRFGASRAYYDTVEERLAELKEEPVPGCYLWSSFLHRRIAPAMRTCRSVQDRLASLGEKLAGAIALLSSWIDVQLEHQNSDLLRSMNDRARLQLRLQETVEGLSVAAISYYVVSLLGHFIEGIPGLHDVIEPGLAVTLTIPVVVLVIWWMVRRIRLAHGEKAKGH